MKILSKSVLVIATILVVGGFLFGPSLLAGSDNVAQAAAETPVFSVRTDHAQRHTLYAYLEVNGDIVSTQQADVFPDVSGRLVSVSAALGDYVRAGDVIAEIDPSRPGSVFMNSQVIAPISGYISRTPLSAGMTVSPNSAITAISANGTLEISARIPERAIAGLTSGLTAEVSLQAWPGEIFSATVNRVSPVIDMASRTKTINLRFDQHDSRIIAGMFARIRINTNTYPNVITVPAEAVISSRGIDSVYVAAINEAGLLTAQRREVSTGVSLQGRTEIRAGLDEGETIIVQGQQLLSGGEQVRVIGAAIAQGYTQ